MLLGVIEEVGELESGFSSFSATLETVGLSLEFSVGKEEVCGQEDVVHGVALASTGHTGKDTTRPC